jgi:NAD(P)-dependent dehydrogenase (short-subunit alcohol dehydrogenase family)
MLESAAQQLGTFPIVADVSNEDDVLRMVREVVKEYKDYSVLINNAGFGAFTPLVDLTAEEFFRVWQTNVLGKVDRRSHRRGPTIQPSFTRKTSLVSSSACWRPRIVGLSPSPPFGLRTPNKTATERVTVN